MTGGKSLGGQTVANLLVNGWEEHGAHLVGLEGKPAHGKDDHHNHQHLDYLNNQI
jgi:hypothetical protein